MNSASGKQRVTDETATDPNDARSLADWERVLRTRLPLYGHRNWIVVADSAYPAQCSEGIETIVADADHRVIVEKVLAAIRASEHVKAVIYTDAELMFVEEEDAPGISTYRNWLTQLAGDVRTLPHEEIISKLDRASKSFRILIIKSNLRIPYTSVFFELDCAYWNANAEMRLRSAISKRPIIKRKNKRKKARR
jgi:L-fucose mutarotase/ribose pyranase (RbsD/FucU family)